MRTRFLLIPLFLLAAATPSAGQSLLLNPAVLNGHVGLSTVPDHGGDAVAFLDYRSGSYGAYVVDITHGTEQKVSSIFYAEPGVAVSSSRVAWIGYTPAGQPDVYVLDRAAGGTTKVTSDAAFQNHVDLSEDVLVWQDYRNAGSTGTNADIYLHDFASSVTSPITSDPGYQDLPRVHGNWVVWQDYRHAGSLLNTAEIYAYNRTSKQEHRLTTGTAYRTHPAVWNNLVVWEDHRNGGNGDIYLYDLSTGQETRLTTNAAHQGQPAVFGDWVLWLDYRNSPEQADIYGYHLKTRLEYDLLVHPAHQEAPNLYENHVVWQDYRDGRLDLFSGMLSEPTLVSVDDPDLGADTRLSATPNPFTHSVTFSLEDAPAAASDLTIYDMLGRAVAQRRLDSGSAVVSWNGISDAGHPVSAGVYVAVVRRGGDLYRVTLVRHE